MMPTSPCPECGAPVPEGGTCRDLFHKLLLLEAEVPGVPGTALHFFVVGNYVLQHPIDHHVSTEVQEGLRVQHAAMLDGETTIAQIRGQNHGLPRISVPKGEPLPEWPTREWPLTVADICDSGVDEFVDRLMRWAHSVREVLDAGSGVATATQEREALGPRRRRGRG